MGEAEKIIYTVFGGIIALAVISVIVGRKSKAPQAIQAFGSALANIVGAAVNPAGGSNNGSNSFTLPQNFGIPGSTNGWDN